MMSKLTKGVTLMMCLLALSSCASLDQESYVADRALENINLSTRAAISSDRRIATFEVRNEGTKDLYCSALNFRAVSDNPNTYLEAGESQKFFGGVFLRAGETFRRTASARSSKIRSSDWRSAEVDLDPNSCRQADFLSYCKFAIKTPAEDDLMLWLHIRFNASSCESLADRMSKIYRIRLPEDQPSAVRPLVFLSDLRSISLIENPANTEWAQEFLAMTYSSFLEFSFR